jgi:hypothetical protein
LNTHFNELDKVIKKWADERLMIKPTLHQVSNYWYRLQVLEETDSVWYNQKLNDCVKWSAEKLKDWPNVNRMSFDMWDFKFKKDAEKFLIIFHLSWQQ